MKPTKITNILIAILLLVSSQTILAQEQNTQMYWVHEDRIKPGMTGEHSAVDKELIAAVKKHNIEVNWLSVLLDNNTALYVSPINSMADLDNDPFSELAEKMGTDNMAALFKKYEPTYKKHGDYVITRYDGLSYMPDGMTTTPDGQNYRRFDYYYLSPQNIEAFIKKAKEINTLFNAAKSPLHYRVYRSGFGTMGDYFMVAIAAKDASDLDAKLRKSREMMGEKFGKALDELLKLTSSFKSDYGWVRPDYSFVSSTN